jgi:hypothetical protein
MVTRSCPGGAARPHPRRLRLACRVLAPVTGGRAGRPGARRLGHEDSDEPRLPSTIHEMLLAVELDLNRLVVPNADGPDVPFSDPSVTSADGSTTVYFRGLADKLIAEIGQADVVIGCVAWLTHPQILEALARTQGVALVVQKEDFLRPDVGQVDRSRFNRRLRSLYAALPVGPDRYAYSDSIVCELSYLGDPTLEPVRCVGGHNATRAPAFPRAHHKFALFCKMHYDEQHGGVVRPYAVWTGSFNFTMNASRSLDNAVLLRDKRFVAAYYAEWAQVLAMSEPLDWTAPWIDAPWRIGS